MRGSPASDRRIHGATDSDAILAGPPPAGVDLVGAIIDALNRGDVDAMLALMHPDFEWRPLEESPVARVYRGHEDVRRYIEDWLTTFEDVRLDLIDPTGVADCVVAGVHGHARGRASGVELDSHFCQVWTVRRGTAVGMKEYATREKALAALPLGEPG